MNVQATYNNLPINGHVRLFNGVIANKNRVYLIGRIREPGTEDLEDIKIEKPVFKYQRDAEIDKKLQLVTTLSGYKNLSAGMDYRSTEDCVLLDIKGSQCVINDMEITEGDVDVGPIPRTRHIDGKLYFVMGSRIIVARDVNGELGCEIIMCHGYKNYETYDRPLKYRKPDYIAMIIEDGFSDVDGFDGNNLYAVGGKGDVWRIIDGGLWTKCGFPSNLTLDTVCCGDDGLVYISGPQGMTYVGKEDNWTALEHPYLSLSFKDMVWYDGKVWATSDYGTWWITPEGIVDADIPSAVKICSGRLNVNAGMLLLVGIGGAALLEDGKWQVIFNQII